MSIHHKVALITGATSGIGKATLDVLVNKGLKVIANGRNIDKLRQLENTYNGNAKNVITFSRDITLEGTTSNMLDLSENELQLNPSVFILCAGQGLPGSLLTSDSLKWQNLLNVNIHSSMNQLKEVSQRFVKYADLENSKITRDIVVIGSTAGRNISSANPVYGATKFAIHSIVESLRQEICEYNIRVSLIEPGFVNSEFQTNSGYNMEWYNSLKSKYGPFLEPIDVAETIEFIIHRPSHVHIDDVRIRPTKQVQ